MCATDIDYEYVHCLAFRKGRALGANHVHEFVPSFYERLYTSSCSDAAFLFRSLYRLTCESHTPVIAPTMVEWIPIHVGPSFTQGARSRSISDVRYSEPL